MAAGLMSRRSWSAGLRLSALLGLMLRSLGAGLLLGLRSLPLDGERLLLGLRLSRGLLLGLRLSRGLTDRLSPRLSLGDGERLCKGKNTMSVLDIPNMFRGESNLGGT